MRVFGDLEAVIMDVMWDRGEPATVRQVHAKLSTARPLAYTTVMTVMDNLHTKGHLTREKDGRAWLYAPAVSREEHTARLMRDALASAADQTATLSLFIAGLGESQSQALRWLLRRRPQGR